MPHGPRLDHSVETASKAPNSTTWPSASRTRSIQRSGSSLHLLGQVVPAFAITYLRAHLPPEGLRLLLDASEQCPDALPDALLALVCEVKAPQITIQSFEVGREGAPQAPIGGAQFGDMSSVDGVSVLLAHGMVVQQGEGVADVLLVELDDLELRKQKLSERNGKRLHGHTVPEGDLVAHPEVADKDVDLPVVLLVEVKQPLPTVHRIEPRLRNVSQGLEEPLHLGGLPLQRDPIQVSVLPLEGGLQAVVRAYLYSYPSEQAKRHVPTIGLLGDAHGLLDHIRPDIFRALLFARHYSSCAFFAASIQGRTSSLFSFSSSHRLTPASGSSDSFMASSRLPIWSSSSLMALMRA